MSNQENISKETKKTRRKKSQRKSQQIKLAVIMIMVSVLVLSASTFAWYQLNNTARVQNMEFKADTLGNLEISDSDSDGNNLEAYSNTLNLAAATDKDSANKRLLPSTTPDGTVFLAPIYSGDGKTVERVESINGGELSKYVYTKVFYLRSGSTQTTKTFTLKLDKGDTTTKDSESGTFFVDKDASANNQTPTAVNAVRVSFKFEDGSGTVKIYEPNSDKSNSGGTSAINNVSADEYGPEKYKNFIIKQNADGTFANGVDTTLCTITEGVPMKVTMYVWFEGMDIDCKSEIALDEIMGQIQFVAE